MKIKNKIKIMILGATACFFGFTTFMTKLNAASVEESNIVKTETWTTSYYLDDNKDTLYPYMKCQADIYSDGKVVCNIWNNYEWNTEEKHILTVVNSMPYSEDSMEYTFKNKSVYTKDNVTYCSVADNGATSADYSFWDTEDLSYYPSDYIMNVDYNDSEIMLYGTENYVYCSIGVEEFKYNSGLVAKPYYYGALSNLTADKKQTFTFIPTVDTTKVKVYNFRLFGHDLTIGNTELNSEEYIKQLEERLERLEKRNTELSETIERISSTQYENDSINQFDTNGDGRVDSSDASNILTLYVLNSSGHDIKTMTEYWDYLREREANGN